MHQYRNTDRVAGDILRYFLRNPNTADNLEGMARWRLLSEAVQRSVQETSQVLEWLVRRGLLLKFDTGGSGPVFRLNLERRAEAEALLAEIFEPGTTGRASEE